MRSSPSTAALIFSSFFGTRVRPSTPLTWYSSFISSFALVPDASSDTAWAAPAAALRAAAAPALPTGAYHAAVLPAWPTILPKLLPLPPRLRVSVVTRREGQFFCCASAPACDASLVSSGTAFTAGPVR